MLTLTRQGLLLSLSATVIPSQGSSDVPVAVVNDINTYVGYTLEPRVGYYLNGIYKSIVCPYDTSAKTFSVPAEAFKQIGIIDITLALIDNANANHIETCQTVHATVNKAPLGTVVLPDQTTWQDYVNSYMNQLFDSNYKPQFDQIQQDLENLVTEAQQQQQTAEQQQTQIDNAISVMGEYQIVSNDPVQIQFKKGDGTYGPTVDLGDGLASKSMVNAGYYQSIGTEYSGSASDYGIEVEEIVGAYSQGLNPSPDNPQEMQAVEISELKSSGRNMFDYQSVVDEATEAGLSTNAVLEEKEGRNCLKVDTNSETFRGLPFLKGRFKTNTQYKFSITGYYEGTEGQAGLYVNIFYTDNSVDSVILVEPNEFSKRVFTSDENKTINNIKFSFGSVRQSWIDLDSSYIVELSEDTGEFPGRFVGDTVTLSEPLILRALPNGVCDTYENGVITRRVGEVVFDGSADEAWSYWEINNSETCRFYTTISKPLIYISENYSICDKLPYILGNVDEEHYRWSSSGVINNQIVIYIKKSRLTEIKVSALRLYLQSNPITIWYQLAEPTTEAFEIPRLQSFYPFTNAWCDSFVQPQQITWNVLTGKSSILDGNGNLIQQGYMTPQDNLLINSDFRSGIINQRGQTNYVGQLTWNYGIDMWKIINCGINVESGDINVFSTSGGYMSQNVEGGLGENDYTAAVYVSLLNSGNAFMYLEGTGKTDEYEISEPGLHVYTFKNVTQGSGLSFKFSNGFNGNINFVKLEKGSTFTGMPPWNYAFEYFKCCRYLYVWYLPEIPSHGYNSINNLSYFTGTAFPVPFSSAPTWTVKQLLMDQVDVSSDLNTINVTPNRCTSISLTGQISTISGTIIFSNEPS